MKKRKCHTVEGTTPQRVGGKVWKHCHSVFDLLSLNRCLNRSFLSEFPVENKTAWQGQNKAWNSSGRWPLKSIIALWSIVSVALSRLIVDAAGCAEKQMSILQLQWIQLLVSPRGCLAKNTLAFTVITVIFYCNAWSWLFQWFQIIAPGSCMCNPYAWLACGQTCSISQLPYVMFGILSPQNLLNVCVLVMLKKKNKEIKINKKRVM